MNPFKRCKLALEILEDRCVPANSVLLSGGVLNIVADPLKAHTAIVLQQTPGVTQVVLDNTQLSFTGAVNQVNYTGGNKNNLFTNLTNVPGTLTFGNGDNVVYSKAAGENIRVGNGNNIIQDQAGGSSITTGNGNDNIYGGPGDSISVGSGHDIVYDILGTNTISVAAHHHRDYIFTSASSTLTGVTAEDRVATFFAANRQAGSGSLVLEQGVLYFTANNNGDQFILNKVGSKYVATYNLNDGTGVHTQTFKKSDVKLVANFGGAGNDTLINNTDLPDVQDGAGGNNFVVGGFGPLDVEKAGGTAGNSIVVGRSREYNDLNGAGAANTTSVLIASPHAHNIFRSDNPADQIFGFGGGNDVFISPISLKRGKVQTPPLPVAPPPPPPPPSPPPSPHPS